jgi:hypothetical protein
MGFQRRSGRKRIVAPDDRAQLSVESHAEELGLSLQDLDTELSGLDL